MTTFMVFEKELEAIDLKIEELKQLESNGSQEASEEIEKLESQVKQMQEEFYRTLTPWQRCKLARHQDRPYTNDYISRITDDFIELH
ncbi:Acetyl-CoA carboxylase, alpha subunit, partial [Candidatus Magnetoovum chiemensis]